MCLARQAWATCHSCDGTSAFSSALGKLDRFAQRRPSGRCTLWPCAHACQQAAPLLVGRRGPPTARPRRPAVPRSLPEPPSRGRADSRAAYLWAKMAVSRNHVGNKI
eukprot:3488257-Prymnesium_polylepis.2